MCVCSLAVVTVLIFVFCPGRGTREGEAGAGGFAPGAGRAEGYIGADAA